MWISHSTRCRTKQWITVGFCSVVTHDSILILHTKKSSIKWNWLGPQKRQQLQTQHLMNNNCILQVRERFALNIMWPITSDDNVGMMNEAENCTEQGWPGKLGQLRPAEGEHHRLLDYGLEQSKSHFTFHRGASRCPGFVQKDVLKKMLSCLSFFRNIHRSGWLKSTKTTWENGSENLNSFNKT